MKALILNIYIKDYESRNEKWNSLYHEIRNLLPEEKRYLISDLDSENGSNAGDYQELGYKDRF